MLREQVGKDSGPARQSTFVSRPNPVTGKMDWTLQDEDYDFQQEIARSGYGDMLHDKDRNEKYFAAIRAAVLLMKSRGQQVRVLDIGTGTGLLSMMAVWAGADTVTACEAFPPMAECAHKVIAANNMADKIKLIPKRSTEVLIGEDLPEKANLLVTELFDTELIGEAAILSYTDAHSRLMETDSLAVPTLGRVFIQAVESTTLHQFNTLLPVPLPRGRLLEVPDTFTGCSGAPSLHDLQIDQLEDELTHVSEPMEVFRFDFSCHKGLAREEQVSVSLTAQVTGRVDAFVMWWDLQMDPQADIWLSCGPRWVRDPLQPVPWRDHWMQAVYYPSTPLPVVKGQTFQVLACHDDFSLWFDTQQRTTKERPVCECGLHVTFSRSHLAQMNNKEALHTYTAVLQRYVTPTTTCLVISEGSLLPFLAAALGARKVFYLDPSMASRRVMNQLLDCNNMLDRVKVLDKQPGDLTESDLDMSKIDIVIAEPYSMAAQLPWQHIYFWYALSALKCHLSANCHIVPRVMKIKAIGLEFRDLHKIRQPVGNCEGFDITHFDNLIKSSSDNADPDIEAQPLWEYPARALGEPIEIASLDFHISATDLGSQAWEMDWCCSRPGDLNGMAFWTEFDFGEGLSIDHGPVDWWGDKVRWNTFSRQGVHLFPQTMCVHSGSKVKLQSRFMPATGDMSMQILPQGLS